LQSDEAKESMNDNGWMQRLNILRQSAEQNVLRPLRTHGWEVTISDEAKAGEYIVLHASRGDTAKTAAILYSSATDNAVYKRLDGSVDAIFHQGQPYMLESFAAGISSPVRSMDDFQTTLIAWNRESSPGQFAPVSPVAFEEQPQNWTVTKRLTSETPIDAIWARLSQLKSATLAQRAVARRAEQDGASIGRDEISSKGEGVAFALSNAADYFSAIDHNNLSQRILNLYYGTMSFAFAEMLAAPTGPLTLVELESITKKGHGLYTHDGIDDDLGNLAVGALSTGFFPNWVRAISEQSIAVAKRKPDGLVQLQATPAGSWHTLAQLFARVPEVSDLFEDVFDVLPAWVIPIYDQEANGRSRAYNTTYIKLADPSFRLNTLDIARFLGPIREIALTQPMNVGQSFRVAIDHPTKEHWWQALNIHHSPFVSNALVEPLFGGLTEYRATCFTLLYALSILVRYRPSIWRRVQSGDLDHFRALIEVFLSAIERILPEQFLERISGQPLAVHQPGSFFG
jgi:hypothetical protein